MHSHVKAIVFLLFSLLYVAGCGQKGPLFLPGNTNEISISISGQQQATPEVDEDEEDEEDEQNRPMNRN